MPEESNYIKDIEKCFLEKAGKGIMLSSKDYDLIEKWQKKNIPCKIVIDAINFNFIKNLNIKYHNISQMEQSINSYIKDNYLNTINFDINKEESDKVIEELLIRINSLCGIESRGNILQAFYGLRNSLVDLKKNNPKDLYKELKNLEHELVEKLSVILDKNSQEDINKKAVQLLPKESRYYDDQTVKNTILSFRKDLVYEKLQIKNIFTGKNDKEQ